MYGPRRGHFLIIFDKFFSSFGALIFAGIMLLFFNRDTDEAITLVIYAAIAVLAFGTKIFSFFFTTYEITEDIYLIRKGVINKKKIEIPLEAITTIDTRQSILFQALGVCMIGVDTTAQLLGAFHGLALKKDEAEEFKEFLLKMRNKKITELKAEGLLLPTNTEELEVDEQSQSRDLDENSNIEMEVGIGKIILFGLLQPKGKYMLWPLVAASSLFGTLMPILKGVFGEAVHQATDSFSNTAARLMAILFENIGIMVLLGFIGVIVISYLIGMAFSVVSTVLKYSSFKLYKDNKTINISYGLFNKRKYSLTKEKVTGVEYKQSFLMRKLGYYTAEVYAIGYGQDEGVMDAALIFPIGEIEEIESLINKLLPELIVQEKYEREKQGTLRYFYYNFPTFFWVGSAAILTLATIFNWWSTHIYASLPVIYLILAVHIARRYLFYLNEKVSIGDNCISCVKGAFGRRIFCLKSNRIETVTFDTSVFKEKKEIGHLRMSSFGPMTKATIVAMNVRKKQYELAKTKIIY